MAKPKCSGPHAGHRMRLRLKAVSGLDPFRPHEVAELLLFETIRRRNTNETAHGLIRRFRSLRGLLTAPCGQLTSVPGIGPASAAWIASILPEAARILTEDLMKGEPPDLGSILPAADLWLNVLGEPSALLTLDADSRLLDWQSAPDPAALRLLLEAEAFPGQRRLLLLRREDAERMLTGLPAADGAGSPGETAILLLTPEHRFEEARIPAQYRRPSCISPEIVL